MPYTAPPGTPPNAAPDDTLTKRPPPRSAITAHAGRLTLSAPRSCVSITASSCASVSSANGAMRTWPALFTTTSTAPNASSAASTMARPPSGVAIGVAVRDRLAAGGDDLGDHRVGGRIGRRLGDAVGVADADAEVVHQHARATRREQERVLAPQVAPRPGDDDDLPVEPQLTHALSSFWRGEPVPYRGSATPNRSGTLTHRCTRACALPSTRRSSRRSCWWSCARRAARCPRGSCASAGSRRRGSPTAAAW